MTQSRALVCAPLPGDPERQACLCNHCGCTHMPSWSLIQNVTSGVHGAHAPNAPPSCPTPPHHTSPICARPSTGRSGGTNLPFYHLACLHIPPWSLAQNFTSDAPNAHAPNTLKCQDLMTVCISSYNNESIMIMADTHISPRSGMRCGHQVDREPLKLPLSVRLNEREHQVLALQKESNIATLT